jgi:hypothetical protein
LEGLTMISWGLFHTTCCGILWTWQISVSTTFLRGPPPNPIPSTAWWCFFFRPGMICRWSALLSFFLPGLQIMRIMTYRGYRDICMAKTYVFVRNTLRGTVPRILMVRWNPSSPQLWLILSVLTLKRLQAHFFRLTRIIVERLGNDRPSDRRDWLWHALPAQLPDVPTGSEQMERICVGESLAVSVTFCSKKVPMGAPSKRIFKSLGATTFFERALSPDPLC